MKEEDIEIVLEYQRTFPELLQEGVDGFVIDTKKLHKSLGVGRDYSTWIKGRINKYNFKESVDYDKRFICNGDYYTEKEIKCMSNKQMSRKSISIVYYTTLDLAILLTEKEKFSENSCNLLKYLYFLKQDNTKIIVRNNKRPEIKFLDKLEETLKPFNIKGIRQYCLFKGKYRIDYYIESKNIAIEYDEAQHFNNKNITNDNIRQKEIEDKLGCKFIRVSVNNSDEYNIGLVIKEIFNI